MAPDFTLTDASGQRVRLSDFRGKVVLLNFWATSWDRSNQEIPWFVEFQNANRVVIGNDQVAERFGGLHTKPLTLIIDRSGRVAGVHSGLCKKEE